MIMAGDHQFSDDERQRADEDRLKRLIKWAVTFSIGGMATFIGSIRQVNPSIELRVDWLTLLVAIIGFGMGWMFWRVIPTDLEASVDNKSKWVPLVLWVSVLSGLMFAGFAYGMKDISSEKQREMYIGTGMAVLVLTFVGFLFWRAVHFFESDHQRYLDQHEDERE